MRIIRRFFSRLRHLLTGRREDRRLEEEIEQHLALQTEANIRAGMTAAEARRQAMVQFGALAAIREDYYEQQGIPFMETCLTDFRYGLRILAKNPGFATAAALSLALAIGANTTIFSAARQLLYVRLGVPDAANLRLLTWSGAERNIAVHHVHGDYDPLPGGLVTSPAFSYPVYQQLRAQNRVLGDLIGFRETGVNLSVRQRAEGGLAEMVSGNYYSVLGVKPQLGRAIEPSDDRPISQAVAVISDRLWNREFGRSRSVLGEVIKVNDKPVVVIGVNPGRFTGVKSALASETPDVIVALAMQPILTPSSDGTSWLTNPAQWWVNVLGRAKGGITNAAAESALNVQLNAAVRATMPVRKGEEIPRLALRDGSRGLFEQEQLFARPLAVLALFVGMVLLLACANIANLMLARGANRQREMSVRLALGAGRNRILRQMFVESFLLAGIGGALGVLLGYLGRLALPELTVNAWQKTEIAVHFDVQVFAFAAAITVLTGILFGFAPALAASRTSINSGLKDNSQNTTRRRKAIGGRALVGFQIALSTLLVIGAGLFIRTLMRLNAVKPGFDTGHLLLVQLPLPENRYRGGGDIVFHERLERSIAAIPGVQSVAPAMESYLSDDLSDTDFLPEGEASDRNRKQAEAFNAVGTRFFETLHIPILAGRAFTPQDAATSPKVGIINQSLARKRFPNQNPLGKRFDMGGHNSDGHGGKFTNGWIQIVGVCGDTLYSNLRQEPPPQFFVPYVQQPEIGGMTYEIRTRGRPETILSALRRVVHALDPDVPLMNVRTEEQQVAADLEQERVFVVLTCGFGFLALVLAGIGIYGVTAYSVAQRTNEIGIRLALGAVPRQVLAMVLQETSGVAAVGIATGAGASFAAMGVARSMLYGVAPQDPATLVSAVLLLLALAVAASWMPARRAMQLQPMNALRQE
jgi:predicted permease